MTRPPFSACVTLLEAWLARRPAIAGCIDARLLNVKGKPALLSRDRGSLDAALAGCFAAGLSREMVDLAGALAASRAADGFEPVPAAGQVGAAALVARAYRHWDRYRWPGANIRIRHANIVYSVFMLRQLEDLALRIWDDPAGDTRANLATLQRLLDALNAGAPSDAMIRDARWLLQTAQGPLTRDPAPYFRLADRIAASFAPGDALVIHAAGARLAGGHLRSQWRHRSVELRRDAADPLVLATTRNSNAMDVALLVRDLVPLLDAYGLACAANDLDARRSLADAILQGCSADPELLLTRLDLLEPYTMLEDIFVATDVVGRPSYTEAGEAHVRLLASYRDRIGTMARELAQDARACGPARRGYSPFAVTYGFCADLVTSMAGDVLEGAPGGGSLEDLFNSDDAAAVVRLRTDRWQRWVARQGGDHRWEMSREWGVEAFERTVQGLEARSSAPRELNASGRPGARLYVVREDAVRPGSLPEGVMAAHEHCVTSDVTRALATGATAFPRSHFPFDRAEGRFLASADVGGTWFGIAKAVLTTCISPGRDAVVEGVPREVCEVLQLTCRHLAVVCPPLTCST